MNVSAQTETETIDFINSKLGLYTASMMNAPAYFKVKTGEDGGKVIIIDLYVSNSLLSSYRFHCNQIDGIITFKAGNGNLCLKLVSSKGLIINKYEDGTKEEWRAEVNMPLQTSDEEVLRLKKAFDNLFKLNGFKPANDDLFKK
jgi:hypothetical protein